MLSHFFITIISCLSLVCGSVLNISLNCEALLFRLGAYIFISWLAGGAPPVSLVMFPMATFPPILNTIETYSVLCLKYVCATKYIDQLSIDGKLIKFL